MYTLPPSNNHEQSWKWNMALERPFSSTNRNWLSTSILVGGRVERERERASGIVAATIAICFVLSAACLGHIEDNRQTALFYAARQGHVRTCNFLVYSKANVDTLDKFGETAWLGAKVQTVAALFLFHCLRLASDIYWFA